MWRGGGGPPVHWEGSCVRLSASIGERRGVGEPRIGQEPGGKLRQVKDLQATPSQRALLGSHVGGCGGVRESGRKKTWE